MDVWWWRKEGRWSAGSAEKAMFTDAAQATSSIHGLSMVVGMRLPSIMLFFGSAIPAYGVYVSRREVRGERIHMCTGVQPRLNSGFGDCWYYCSTNGALECSGSAGLNLLLPVQLGLPEHGRAVPLLEIPHRFWHRQLKNYGLCVAAACAHAGTVEVEDAAGRCTYHASSFFDFLSQFLKEYRLCITPSDAQQLPFDFWCARG